MPRTAIQNLSFFVVMALVSVAALCLVLPFFGAILWATILAVLFSPIHRAILRRIEKPTIAAFFSLLICIVVAVIPGVMILSALAQEATDIFQRVRSRQFDPAMTLDRLRAAMPHSVLTVMNSLELGDYDGIRGRITAAVASVTQGLATQLLAIGQGTARFIVSLAVMLYLLFFLFRDGPTITASIKAASLLAPDHTNHIMEKFTTVVRATVLGNFAIAFSQGLIGGVTFWLLGFQGALIWGVLMTGLSLLPAVGAFLVWVPAAVYLLMTGAVMQGLLVAGVGIFLITAADYLIRPILVGKTARLPDYVILLSTMGGIALIGINGFVIGPLIAALFFSVWSIFMLES